MKRLLLVVLSLMLILAFPSQIHAEGEIPSAIYNILNRKKSDNRARRLIDQAIHKDVTIDIVTQDDVEKDVKDKKKEETPKKQGDENSYIKGIDISKWNGEINWKALKEADIEFVIIRAGYGTTYVDPYFHKNMQNAIDNNMIIGVYWFSYAYTEDMAREEAKKCMNTVSPYKKHIYLPIFYDFEYDSVNYASRRGVRITKNKASKFADVFCKTIKQGGYPCGIYTNIDYTNRYFTEEVLSKYHTWIAQWTRSCTYKSKYIIWQCSDSYYVLNRKFDLNFFYYNRYKK